MRSGGGRRGGDFLGGESGGVGWEVFEILDELLKGGGVNGNGKVASSAERSYNISNSNDYCCFLVGGEVVGIGISQQAFGGKRLVWMAFVAACGGILCGRTACAGFSA